MPAAALPLCVVIGTSIDALKAGRVDGSSEGACLVGIIAAARFFHGISLGDTPETSQFSALALAWTSEWLDTMRAAFGPAA